MLRDPLPSSKPHELIGVDALSFLAEDLALLGRFLDLSGLTIPQLRAEAKRPGFFVGLLDFILAHEPTLMAFAAHAGIRPEDVGQAREAYASTAGT